MTASRDVLVHQYAGVDLDKVWAVVEGDLLPIKRAIRAVLPLLEELECQLAGETDDREGFPKQGHENRHECAGEESSQSKGPIGPGHEPLGLIKTTPRPHRQHLLGLHFITSPRSSVVVSHSQRFYAHETVQQRRSLDQHRLGHLMNGLIPCRNSSDYLV
jgi:hypothetical protein